MKAKMLNFAIALIVLFNYSNTFAQGNKPDKDRGNAHFNDAPITTDKGNTLEQCGDIYGLAANQTYIVVISADATITTECTNPGGHVAPGQTKTVRVSASGSYTADRNGHVHYCLETTAPTAGNCPNGKWTGNVISVDFGPVTTTLNGQPIRIVGN